jgi:serine/threonine protein kinase
VAEGASSLAQGDVVGRYRILYKLGAGGMGEVYAAEDTRLGRKVALKILPPEVAHDQERRARFEREARAIAALSHPSIVVVHAVEELEGRLAIVMELIEGRTLAEMTPPGGMALPQLLEIALPLVQAVAAAHQTGITHRDLKPQNVMVTTDGRVKVLDFGLAKMNLEMAGDLAQQPTVSVTGEGKLVGTVAYMSPEQAQGKKVDVRSDVFALGVVLFELATGRRPFQGDSAVSILSAILKDEPPSVSTVRSGMPGALDRVLRRCLAKDPLKRYQTAIDLQHDLEELRNPAQPARRRSGAWRWVATLPLVALVAVMTFKLLQRERGDDGPRVASLMHLTSAPDQELEPSLSPDGTWFVYASKARNGNWDIYRQRVGGENAQNLTADCDQDDVSPAISPDGERIAFHSGRGGGGLFVMGATGESVRKVADVGFDPSFTPDGAKVVVSTIESELDPRFLGSAEAQVWLIDVESGEKKRIVSADQGMKPVVDPSGKRIAFWRVHTGGMRDLFTASLDGGAAEPLTDDRPLDYDPAWSPDGRWLYFASDRGGNMNLWRIGVDANGKARGTPDWVSDGAMGWMFAPAFSRDGQRMVFVAGGPADRIERIAFDPVKEEVIGQPTRIASGFTPAVVKDQLVYFATEPHEDIMVARTDGTARRRLTDDPFRDRVPRLSPDGQKVAFYSDRSGAYELWSEQLDGSGLTQLTQVGHLWYPIWSPDGKRMAGCSLLGAWIFDPNKPWKDQTPTKLATLPDGRIFCGYDWSPDGKLLVGPGASPGGFDDLWTYEVETRQFRQVLKGDVADPRFLSDSRRVVLNAGGRIKLVDLPTGRSKLLLEVGDGSLGSASPSPDDRTLYFEHHAREADVWLATLKR